MKGDEFEGSHFEGENKKSNFIVGRQSLVTVDVFKRPNGTHFMRVNLRSVIKPLLTSRYEIDMDKYTNESTFLAMVALAGGAIAERQCDLYGDRHDPDECAKAAQEAAREVLRRI